MTTNLRAGVARELPVRWRDLDPLGHVGHAVFLEYFEEARNALLLEHGLAVDQHVVASATINYRREIRADTTAVIASSSVGAVGRSSLTTHEELRDAGGQVLADGNAVVVLWDVATRSSRPITDAERASLEAAP